jgi:hypothetical protein
VSTRLRTMRTTGVMSSCVCEEEAKRCDFSLREVHESLKMNAIYFRVRSLDAMVVQLQAGGLL